jgi:hypothetical protein
MGNPFNLDLGFSAGNDKKNWFVVVPDDLTDVLNFFIGTSTNWQDTLIWNVSVAALM